MRGEIATRRAAAVTRASAEAETLLARGKEELLALRREEDARLRAELQSCVTQTLGKMLPSVDEPAVRLMVQRALGLKAAE
jgi:hypothetical protein